MNAKGVPFAARCTILEVCNSRQATAREVETTLTSIVDEACEPE